MKLNDIKSNPNNPRVIKDEKFEKLKKSIQEFPKMMKLRPMVINADSIVLGGNMRLKALKELGYKEIPDEWVKRADELTEDEQRRFIIVDNVGFGEHDWEMLSNEWNIDELEEWGIDCPNAWNENEKTKVEEKEIKPFSKTHILLSFAPNKILELKPFLDEILQIDGIDYEQSSN